MPVRAVVLFLLALPAARGAGPVTFETDVKPVLRKHCLTCHNAERPRGELDLSTRAAVLAGGTSGKAVVAGKPDESTVYTLAAHLDTPKMPPNKPKMPEKDLDIIKKWIEGGLVEKATGDAPAKPAAGGKAAVLPLARPTAVTALAVNPAGTLVALPGNKQVLLFDRATQKFVAALPFPEGEVHALRFSTDGTLLLAGGGVGGQAGLVVAFDPLTGKRAFAVGDEGDAVLACDLSPDKTKVALGGPTRAVKVFATDGKLLHTFRKPTDWVTAVRFSPDGLLVAAGDRFGTLFVWETDSGKEYATLRGHTKGVTGLAWRPDGNAVATTSDDGTVRVWDAHTLAELRHWPAHVGGSLALDWHGSGRLATAGRDNRAIVWDADGKKLAEFGPAADHVLKVAFTPDGVVTGDWAGDVKAWRTGAKDAAPIVRPTKPKAAVAVVLPPKPATLVATTAVPAADDLTAAKRALARKAAASALDQLKLALSLDPDNAPLAKAVTEAEAAVRTLTPEGGR
jgi:WD40 repeat protein